MVPRNGARTQHRPVFVWHATGRHESTGRLKAACTIGLLFLLMLQLPAGAVAYNLQKKAVKQNAELVFMEIWS